MIGRLRVTLNCCFTLNFCLISSIKRRTADDTDNYKLQLHLTPGRRYLPFNF